MGKRWVLVHNGADYELPSQAVARFMQRRPLVSDRVNARKVRLLKAANKQSK